MKRFYTALILLGLPMVVICQTLINKDINYNGIHSDVLTQVIATDSTYLAYGFVPEIVPINDSLAYVARAIIGYELDQNLDTIRRWKYPSESIDIIAFNTFIDNNGLINLVGLKQDTNYAYSTLWYQIDEEGDLVNDFTYYSSGYPDSNFIAVVAGYQEPTTGRYVLATNETTPSSKPGILITDSLGNVLHRRTYDPDPQPPFGRRLSVQNMQPKLNSSNYILVGRNMYPQGHPQSHSEHLMYILEVDSVGNIVEEWSSPPDIEYGTIWDFIQMPDGELIVVGEVRNYPIINFQYYQLAAISKINASKEIIWTDSVNTVASASLFDVELVSDGYVSAGAGIDYIPNTTEINDVAILHKTDFNGDSIWSRRYSILEQGNIRSLPRSMTTTPDGGFLIAGYVNYPGAAPFEPPMYVPQQRGWLVKVDEFGCLVPDCQLVSTDELPATEPPFQILTYPNPSTDRLNVFLKTAPGAGPHTGQLLDATGRPVRQFGGTAAEVTYVLDTQELPAGIYFLRVVVDGRWVRSERVVVQ